MQQKAEQRKQGKEVVLQQPGPMRWTAMDNPFVYGIAVIFAVAVYVDSLNETSLVNTGLVSISKELVEIGERGLLTTVKEVSHLQSTLGKSLVLVLAVGL